MQKLIMVDLHQIYQTEEMKVNFLKGLLNIAKADGIIEHVELDFFKNAAISLGISETKISELTTFATGAENIIDLKFDNKEQAIMLLREGLQLCYIDGKYGDNEKVIISEISEHLNIGIDTLNEIELWVSEGIKWSERGNDLLKLEV